MTRAGPSTRAARALLCTVACATALLVSAAARQVATQPQQTFRSSVDLIQLDVSVLDENRHPVRGLTAGDFTVTEGGQVRPVVAFKAIELPAPVPHAASWMRDVAADTTTNAPARGRVVVIAMALPAALSTLNQMKQVAAASEVINGFGPDDLGAVIYLFDGAHSQGFTRDRGRLLDAITRRPSLTSNYDSVRTHCVRADCFVDRFRDIVETLRTMDQGRKTIVYIGRGFAFVQKDPGTAGLVARLLREAQRANVVIHAVDPSGLSTRMGIDPSIEGLRTLAEGTGGRAVVNENDPEREMPSLLEESRTYYLIGIESSGRKTGDGFHPVKVTVDRSGVEVRTRSGYYDSRNEAGHKIDKRAATAESVDASLEGFVPSPDVPLVATVAPFAGDRDAVLAIAVGVDLERESAHTGTRDKPAPSETLEVAARAIDSEGRSSGVRRLTLQFPSERKARGFEVLPRLAAPPGIYEIRIGVRTTDGRIGSVYTRTEVPDFAHAPLCLSGVVLSASPGAIAAPHDAFEDVLPVVPTSRRSFGTSDHVTVFGRIYQGRSERLTPVVLSTRILNEADEHASEDRVQIAAASFGARRVADYSFPIPTSRLPRGKYVLKIDVEAGGRSSSRAVRFQIE
jgi:VWFA-related protein